MLRGSLVTAALCPGARAPVDVDFAGTASPGLRAIVAGDVGGVRGHQFQIDLAIGDPMAVPARPVLIPGVGAVVACAAETLFGWKLHGLCEHGRGRWRAKDLFDLDLLWRHAGLDREATRAGVAVAFGSRGLGLAALDDFRSRGDWGTSRGGVRKWRALTAAHPGVEEFLVVRERVREALGSLGL